MQLFRSTVSMLALLAVVPIAGRAGSIALPTGQSITPNGAPHAIFKPLNPNLPSSPTYTVGQAVSTAVSPDGKTLLILTSGYNDDADPATQSEFVFVFDISKGTPVQLQALPIPNAFCGVAWSPDGSAFYVGGGQDDNLHIFKKSAGAFVEALPAVALKHSEFGITSIPAGNGLFSYPGLGAAVSPLAAGVTVTPDGHKVLVANLENDSISVIDLTNGNAAVNVDLRPGRNPPLVGGKPVNSGVPGGEFPFWVVAKDNNTAYVSSERDRQIVIVNLAGPYVVGRIPVLGNPNKMVLNKAGTRLFVTTDNADQLYQIDTTVNQVVGKVQTSGPAGLLGADSSNGSAPNSVALSPDEKTAYVTNASTNSVAVIDVSRSGPVVKGLIPTGWYPNAVSVSADGKTLYVVNGKSPTGPIPNGTSETYDEQLLKAGFLTLSVPNSDELAALTAQVAKNNGFNAQPSATDVATMNFLHGKIKHIIYIVKENRTYDQILGDLPVGNGDPSLTMYGQAITPNFHAISTQFVDLDNFYDSGEISMNGWQWSTSGRGNDLNEKIGPVNYGKGGGSYDSEGLSRDINVGQATTAGRLTTDPAYGLEAVYDPDLLPGSVNVVAPDSPSGEVGAGFIWDDALRAGLSIRNYGFFQDLVRYEAPAALGGISPNLRNPYATKTQVAFATDASLVDRTDPYFRGFDNQFPDFWRYQEWAREFDHFAAANEVPAFQTVRFMHDHTGNFDTAIDGVNTPALQQADNDYAVGLLIDHVAHSPLAASTLVFVIEDDSQDGPDHVDSHRSTAYIAGPYIRHGSVVSERYTTVSMLRTIEDILGLQHLSLHDAGVAPMSAVFDIKQSAAWTYTATPAASLLGTQLPIAPGAAARHAALEGSAAAPLHNAAWWAKQTKGFRFDKEDENDEDAYNRILWKGEMGDKPYPTERSGLDLRNDRAALLKSIKLSSED